MPNINLNDITPEALTRFQKVYAESPDGGTCLVWDSHRLPVFTAPKVAAGVIEDAFVAVPGFGDNDLEPIRARIRAAGRERGLAL